MKTREFLPLMDRPPGSVIAFDAHGAVNATRFLEEVMTLAGRLPAKRYVINLHSDRYRYLVGFCAATVANQCTLMPPNRLPLTLTQLMEEYRDCYLLGEDQPLVKPEGAMGSAGAPADIAADQLSAIAFTSGSTGRPKANLKYWRTLRDGTRSNERLLLEGAGDCLSLLVTVPPQHMWGMEMSILLPLFTRVSISNRTPFFPQNIAEALATLPEPRALVSSPVHLDALLKSGVSLPALTRIYTATAPLSEALANELEERFTTVVTDVFGCSETGVLAARSPARDRYWTASAAFELVNRKDGTLVRADHLPGDVLMPDIIEGLGNGRFRWVGRHQDIINIAGKRGSLADLNQRLQSMPGVIDGVIFLPGRSRRLAALVVGPGLAPSDVLGYLKTHLEPVFLPRPVYLVPDLPRQETGKLALHAVLEMFENIRTGREQAEVTGTGR